MQTPQLLNLLVSTFTIVTGTNGCHCTDRITQFVNTLDEFGILYCLIVKERE